MWEYVCFVMVADQISRLESSNAGNAGFLKQNFQKAQQRTISIERDDANTALASKQEILKASRADGQAMGRRMEKEIAKVKTYLNGSNEILRKDEMKALREVGTAPVQHPEQPSWSQSDLIAKLQQEIRDKDSMIKKLEDDTTVLLMNLDEAGGKLNSVEADRNACKAKRDEYQHNGQTFKAEHKELKANYDSLFAMMSCGQQPQAPFQQALPLGYYLTSLSLRQPPPLLI
ncbi:MAG: hypothetical protein MMC33_001013 [Icmadophila ericetorum]|nr:hypothetical protein [Icmadophila ericetorum]